MRRTMLLLVLLTTPVAGLSAQEVNLRCTVEGRDYVFSFNEEANTLHHVTVQPPYPFERVAADRLQIMGQTPARPIFGQEDDVFHVRIQRVTGAVELVWMMPRDAEEERQCRAAAAVRGEGAPWCSFPRVRRAATGNCQRIERLF